MKLYELAEGIRKLLADADDRDGLLTDEDLAQLDSLTNGFDGKVKAICQMVREEDSEIAARQAEIDRLAAGIKTANNRKDRLKKYLFDCMNNSGNRKVDVGTFKVWIQANGQPSCECLVAPEDLPEEFRRVKIEADNLAAVKVWKETGTAPEGFSIVKGEHLRIK